MSDNLKKVVDGMVHRLEKTYWLIAVCEIISGVGIYFLFQEIGSDPFSVSFREGVKAVSLAFILLTIPISFNSYKNGIFKVLKQENLQERVSGYAKVWLRRWWIWIGCYGLNLIGYIVSKDAAMLYMMGILVILTLVMRPAPHQVKDDLKIY